MPELPEVETVMRGMEPLIKGNTIHTVILNRKNLRIPFSKNIKSDLEGYTVTSLRRRAKYILVTLDNHIVWVIHLGMSGRISLISSSQEYLQAKHDHMIVSFKDGSRFIYNDPRRFGMIFTVPEKEISSHKYFVHLGPEPLTKDFSDTYLQHYLHNKTGPIKSLLLDQKTVVGVGNIYACEALFMAGIDPQKPVHTIRQESLNVLVKAIKQVLKKAIDKGGSTLKDYRHTDGELGYFQHHFKVYGKEGEACPVCLKKDRQTYICRIVQSGRSTFYCPKCQK